MCREVHIFEVRDADEHGVVGGSVVDADIDETSVAAHHSITGEDVAVSVTVDMVDGAPDRLTFEVVGCPFNFVEDFGEVRGGPREPYSGAVGVGAHAGSLLSTNGEHTDLQGILEQETFGGKLRSGEDVLEGVVGVSTAVEVGHVAGENSEGASTADGTGISHGVNGTAFIVAHDDTGEVLTSGSQENGVVSVVGVGAENDAEGVDGNMYRVVEDGVIVSFPEADGADGGAASDLVREEAGADGPGGGVGVVEVVGIGAAEVAVGAGGEDGTTGKRGHLLESGGSNHTAVARPKDVCFMVEDKGTVVIPVKVMFAIVGVADVMGEMCFDDGAGVAVGAADDGTVRADGEAIDLDVVESTVFVGEAEESKFIIIIARVDTTVGSKIVGVEGDVIDDMVDRDNLVNAGMYEAVVIVDVGHIVTAVEFEFAGADGGPLVVAAIYITLTDHDSGAADDDTTRIPRVDSDGTGGTARGVGDGHDGGGGKGAPSLFIVGDIKCIHQAVGFDDHSIEVGCVGLRDSEFDAGVGASESGVSGRDIDGGELAGRGYNVTDAVELVAAAEEGSSVVTGDNELVDSAVEDGCGSLTPVVGTVDMTPTVEAAVGGGIKIEDTVDIDIFESMDGFEVIAGGVGNHDEGGVGGIETIDTDTLTGHFAIGGTEGVVVVTSTDIDDIVGSLCHSVDGKGILATVELAGDTMPNGGVASEDFNGSLVVAEAGVESVEVVTARRFDEETAGGGASIDGGAVGVLSVDDKTGDLSTDIIGTDFIETGTVLGACDASGQRQ